MRIEPEIYVGCLVPLAVALLAVGAAVVWLVW